MDSATLFWAYGVMGIMVLFGVCAAVGFAKNSQK